MSSKTHARYLSTEIYLTSPLQTEDSSPIKIITPFHSELSRNCATVSMETVQVVLVPHQTFHPQSVGKRIYDPLCQND